MSDVFSKSKRSEVMGRIRGRGNRDTEMAFIEARSRPHALQDGGVISRYPLTLGPELGHASLEEALK